MLHNTLCLVTDEATCKYHSLYEIITAAVKGGVNMVQLREKEISTKAFIKKAEKAKSILAPLGVPLIINDRVDVALAVEAEGVHVGQEDMPIAHIIQLMPKGSIIGLSIESPQDITTSHQWSNISYLGVSPIFLTATKKELIHPWGIDGIKKIMEISRTPLMAIGGIHLENVDEVLATGITNIAVVSALCAAKHPMSVAQKFRKKIFF